MAAAASAPPSIQTYRQYFADESRDPHSESYRPLLSKFWAENNPSTSQALYNLVSSADTSQASAFLFLRQDGNDAFFQVLHSLGTYPAVIGRPSPWDGKAYASVGGVVNGMITTVDLQPSAFEYSHGGLSENVPNTLARARELLTQSPDLEFLGPFLDNDAQITTTRTRQYIPLPFRYVNLFLDREVKVRKGFIDLSTLMEAQGDDVACAELRDWLLLAVTRGTPEGTPHLVQPAPSVPMADRRLLAHRLDITHRHLPGLRLPTDGSSHLDTLVGKLIHEQRLTRIEASDQANAAQAPKTVAKALGSEVVSTLLAIIGVSAEEDLPQFWRDVAQAGKRDRQALEQALLSTARDLGMADAAPVVTPDLVKRATGLQWAGLSVDNLSEGIQPFSIILPDYVGSEVGVEAQRLAKTYDIMNGTQTTASLKDAQTVNSGKAVIPKDFGEARAHLVALMMVWTVLLGDTHPFVCSFGQRGGRGPAAQSGGQARFLPHSPISILHPRGPTPYSGQAHSHQSGSAPSHHVLARQPSEPSHYRHDHACLFLFTSTRRIHRHS
mmetsp:Transcript_17336/g.26829  ORF Transcript_17336/g.26829 Transcript_17336/m.26829 type:complete len:554 (-) Transcript_17336:3169-4830(-)